MNLAEQFSVALVNNPGRLSKVLVALQKGKVGWQAFCVMDSATRSVLRFIPDDPALAASALETAGVKFEQAPVLLVEVSAQTGGLPKICRKLAAEHLNIDYAYGSQNANGSKTASLAVIKVNDLSKAQRVLAESGKSAPAKPNKRPGRRPAYAR